MDKIKAEMKLKPCPFCGGIPIIKKYSAEKRPFMYFNNGF